MKRTIITLFICTIALTLASCSGQSRAEKRAHIWLTNNIDHALSPDGNKLFYFDTYSRVFGRPYATFYTVDLKSFEKTSVKYLTMEDGTKFYCAADCHGLYTPEDKGYNGASQVLIRAGKYVSESQVYPKYHLFIFDTEKETVKDLGISDGFECHNGIISNFYNPAPSFGPSRISNIYFFNRQGEAVQPKFYEGTLGNKPTTLEVVIKDGTFVGSYYRTTKGRKYPIGVVGTINAEGNVELNAMNCLEYNDPDYHWSGVLKEGKFEGSVTDKRNDSTLQLSFTEIVSTPEAQN